MYIYTLYLSLSLSLSVFKREDCIYSCIYICCILYIHICMYMYTDTLCTFIYVFLSLSKREDYMSSRRGSGRRSYNILHHNVPHTALTATHCNTLQHFAALCSTLQHSAALCSTLQHSESASVDIKNRSLREHRVDIHACDTATHCNTQQRAATHCNTLQSKE